MIERRDAACGRRLAWPAPAAPPTTTTVSAAAAASASTPMRLNLMFCLLVDHGCACPTSPGRPRVTRRPPRRAARGTAASRWECAAYASLMKSAGVGGRGGFGQHHRHLLGQPVALAEIARRARCDDVLPDGVAAAAPRHHVVERQTGRRSYRNRRTPSRHGRRAHAARCVAAPRWALARTSAAGRRAARRMLLPPTAAGGPGPLRARPSACARARVPV